MKHLVERMISAVLAAALVFCTVLPVWAAGEESAQVVTVSASLDKPVLEANGQEQKVVFTVRTSAPISVHTMMMCLTAQTPLKLIDLSGIDEESPLTLDDYEEESSTIIWENKNVKNSDNVTNLAVATFSVPADINIGTYEIGVSNIITGLTDGGYEAFEDEQGASATLTITKKETADGYSAGVTAVMQEITVADKAEVSVSVSHVADKNFAAGELVLKYDSTMLTFNKDASYIRTAQVKDVDGVLTLEDYGDEKLCGNSVYKLAFTPKMDGSATVTLKSAAFVNKTDAAKRDLIPATISTAAASFTVAKRRYTVTLPEDFTGATEAVDGEKYTFRASDYEHYDYTNVTATVGGNKVTVTDDGKGNYTIEAVNGIVEISGTRTPKKYNVTFEGNGADDIKNKQMTATYGTDYTFTMPTKEDYAYSLDEITIGGKAYDGYAVKDSVYTIPGKAVTGDICIRVSKEQTAVKVEVEGDGAGAANGYEVKAGMNKDYTLTLKPEEGYTYTVTATMDGKAVTLIQDGDTYKIENVTGSIIFTVTRTVITNDVSVKKYLGVNDKNVWLVLKTTKLAEGKVPTYDGAAMFWSDEYKAYCYLVIEPTLALETAEKRIGIDNGQAVSVDYRMDVNMTKKVDASDAQLVYNIYNVMYNDFTSENMTMEKFLRADVNGDKVVDTKDAVMIISHLFKTNAGAE